MLDLGKLMTFAYLRLGEALDEHILDLRDFEDSAVNVLRYW